MKKLILIASLFLASCGGIKEIKHDYQQSQSVERIVIPEDMPTEQVEERLVDYHPATPREPFESDDYIYFLPIPSPIAKDIAQQIAIHRLGSAVWLYVPFIPSQLWPTLQQYFDQEGMTILAEDGSQGLIDVQSSSGSFRFRIQQGFQKRSSELSVRALAGLPQWQWPEEPVNDAAELDALQKAAQFLLKIADEKAYSFIAQGISVEQRMDEVKDEDGLQRLLLFVDFQRAFASLKLGLERAYFEVEEIDAEAGVVTARYMPPVPEADQPGWFKRLFGFRRMDYDKRIPYAGNTYQYSIVQEEPKVQKIIVFRPDAKWPSARAQRHEYNTMIRLLKGFIR